MTHNMLTPSSSETSPQAEANYRLGYIRTISLVAALGGLLFGYDWVVIGGAKPFFEPFFQIPKDSFSSGWVEELRCWDVCLARSAAAC